MGRSHLKTSRLKDTASPRWLAATQTASWEVSAFWVESVCVCDRAESKMFSIRQKMNPGVALLAFTPYLDSRLRKIVEKLWLASLDYRSFLNEESAPSPFAAPLSPGTPHHGLPLGAGAELRCVDLASEAKSPPTGPAEGLPDRNELTLRQAETHQEIVFLPGDGLKQSCILRLVTCSPLHCVYEPKWIPISRSKQTDRA